MPDSLQNVRVPANNWVDLYAALALPIGTQLTVENSGDVDVYLAVQAAEPPQDHDGYAVVKRAPSVNMQNVAGDVGAWAYCRGSDGKLSIATPNREGFTPTARTNIHDGLGRPIESLNGALDVHLANVHADHVSGHVREPAPFGSPLTVQVNPETYTANVVDASGYAGGDSVLLGSGEAHMEVVSVAGDTLTFDRRSDDTHPIGTVVSRATHDMATAPAGTIAAPRVFSIGPPAGAVWRITEIIFSMAHGSAGDLSKFGGLPALQNGLVTRTLRDGNRRTFANWKTNADMKTDTFDLQFDARSGGQGAYGTSGRWSFARSGVVLKLDGDTLDRFEVYVQDDITALDSFELRVHGYIEGGGT